MWTYLSKWNLKPMETLLGRNFCNICIFRCILLKSPLIVEALALRSWLISAGNRELSSLNCFSDNKMLIRAINSDNQIKEIYVSSEISNISSLFSSKYFFLTFSRSLNEETHSLVKHFLSSLYMDPKLG